MQYGLLIENPEAIKTVHMALLQGQKFGLHDPMNILQKDLHGWADTEVGNSVVAQVGVFVDYHTTQLLTQYLVLRPKILSVGVGCNRNTDVKEIFASVKDVFAKFNLSINSINNIATIEAKADEQGILELARVLNVPVRFFSPEELDRAGSVPTPSEVVKKHMGVASICEAAAILASRRGKLLVPKQVMKNVTVAVGLRCCMSLE
jgi:cobalt-precorrin 5A hydrolase